MDEMEIDIFGINNLIKIIENLNVISAVGIHDESSQPCNHVNNEVM